MTGIVSVQQMKEIEKACNDMGIDYLRLMENAGSAAAAFIRKKRISVVEIAWLIAWKREYGGDAFVVARKLFEHEGIVSVILASECRQLRKVRKCWINFYAWELKCCRLDQTKRQLHGKLLQLT